MKKYDVVFFIEHKDRELESVKLVVETLRDLGVSCVILSIYFHAYKLYSVQARLYVFPFVISEVDWPISIVHAMYGDRVNYLNMNWEQLLSRANINYKKPRTKFSQEKVKHITWDLNFKKHLLDCGVLESNIRVTGNPANSLLVSMLKRGEQWKEKLANEFGIDATKKIIFLPMNYAWAFASDSLIKAKIENGYPESEAWKYREYSHKCLKEFTYFIQKISLMGDYEVIIRPHPSISEEQYENVFISQLGFIPSNIFINKSYSIREWIIASDIVGSSWSTSVWDAYNIGKPVFLFTPHKVPDFIYVWWYDKVANIVDFDEDLLSIKEQEKVENDSVENISSFIVKIIHDTSIPLHKEVFPRTVKGFLKIVKSFMLDKRILPAGNLKYDYFNIIK
jgi:surface carbohydrate biosynthesis protein